VPRAHVARVGGARIDRIESNGQQLAHVPTVLRRWRPPRILRASVDGGRLLHRGGALSTDNSQRHPLSLHRATVVASHPAYGAAR
jgi:hypothetical protein